MICFISKYEPQSSELDRLNASVVINEKRGQNFASVVSEWETKVGAKTLSTCFKSNMFLPRPLTCSLSWTPPTRSVGTTVLRCAD